jgi:hypothetical protein
MCRKTPKPATRKRRSRSATLSGDDFSGRPTNSWAEPDIAQARSFMPSRSTSPDAPPGTSASPVELDRRPRLIERGVLHELVPGRWDHLVNHWRTQHSRRGRSFNLLPSEDELAHWGPQLDSTLAAELNIRSDRGTRSRSGRTHRTSLPAGVLSTRECGTRLFVTSYT